MNKEQAKEKLRKLISEFEDLKRANLLKDKNEAFTKQRFIQPLFEILGWDFHKDVWPEEKVSKDRVDFAFKIDDFTKFFVEAKKFSVDIDDEQWAKQAIDYAWNKSVTWAVLTDFEGLKIFNSEWNKKPYRAIKEFKYTEYLERFDELWFLSKESIEKGELDKKAEGWGVKEKKIPVTKQLAEDLTRWRDELTFEIKEWNKEKKYKDEEIDEAVQRFLDRLIFIRYTEDKELEPRILEPMLREFKKSGGDLIKKLNRVFRQFDNWYDSRLFEKHFSEEMEIYSDKLEKIIYGLYRSKKSGHPYDFSAISADVLGAVYEQYLGYLQKKNGENKNAKRKEQGIYYTPAFVVDYIVQNTLGVVLREKGKEEIKNIKILDPACGSGSFLIKAYQTLIDYYQKPAHYKIDTKSKIGKFEKLMMEKEGIKEISVAQKLNILRESIYGVDLDAKAVEITQLNLLLKAIARRTKLPNLSHSIVCGNSLISGEEKELEKYFGKNWQDKRPFNWEEEFKGVFKQGGFDVVIGNPPWGANIDEESKYLGEKYPDSTKAHKDIYKIFIDKAIGLLKPAGILGFIVPNTFLYQPRYQDIKEVIDRYENFVINLGEHIFSNVQLPSCIFILRKKKGNNKIVIDLTKIAREELPSAIINTTPESAAKASATNMSIIKNTGLTFDEVFLLKDGGVKHQRTNIGKADKGKSDLRERIYYSGKLKDNKDYPLLIGSDINRYLVYNKPTFILRADYKSLLNEDEIVYFDKKMMTTKTKIVWRQTADKIRAVIIGEEWFANTLQCAVIKDNYFKKVDLCYALAIFNSKYIDFIYRQKVLETGKVFPQVKLKYLRDLPFIIGAKGQQAKIAELAQKMLDLNKRLQPLPENSDKWREVKTEIEKTDKEINKRVYELYGLTEEERKVIENN